MEGCVIQVWSSFATSREVGFPETGTIYSAPLSKKTNGWKVGRMGVAVSWIEVMSNLEAGTAVESGPADAAF